jgi:hypothetical protein
LKLNGCVALKPFRKAQSLIRAIVRSLPSAYSIDTRMILDDGTHNGDLAAHATWVIFYASNMKTVNIAKNKVHITNWFGDERCHVYEDGTCNCDGNRIWNICKNPQARNYVSTLVALATAARINAKHALEQAGYNVTQD